jgi:hypothetical protein
MAFFFVAAGTRVQSASAATLTPTLTTDAARPSRLKMAVCQVKNNAVITTATAGWTKIAQQDSGAGFTAALFIGTATAANPVFTWTGAAACGAVQWYYSNGSDVVETAVIGAISVNTGSGATHSSAAVTTTRYGSLAVYVDVTAANTSLATPANWTENFELGTATDQGATVSGSRQMAAAGSSSGAISVTGGAAAWVQWQVELLITAAPAGLTTAETEVTGWLSSGPGLGLAETEVAGWLSSGPGLGLAETEIVLWIGPPPVVSGRRRQTYIN